MIQCKSTVMCSSWSPRGDESPIHDTQTTCGSAVICPVHTHTRDIQYVTIYFYLPYRMLPVCTDVAHRRAILAFSDFIAVGGDKCRLVGGTAHGQARDNSSRACASALFSVRLSEPLVDIIHTSKSRLLSTCYC